VHPLFAREGWKDLNSKERVGFNSSRILILVRGEMTKSLVKELHAAAEIHQSANCSTLSNIHREHKRRADDKSQSAEEINARIKWMLCKRPRSQETRSFCPLYKRKQIVEFAWVFLLSEYVQYISSSSIDLTQMK
jgi:hypothetical protein